MIDTHCHIDRFPAPLDLSRKCEQNAVQVVAVTNLPSHYEMALPHLEHFRFVVPAIGIHPLSATDGRRELGKFRNLAARADYIGEIGLDFSEAGLPTKAIQESVLYEILECISDRPRFITLHSRGAAKPVLESLERHRIANAVFHWFSGTLSEFSAVIDAGHLVSFNPAMLRSAKSMQFLKATPLDRILVESDGPYAKIGGKSCRPEDIAKVYKVAAEVLQVTVAELTEQIRVNFVRAHGRIESATTGGFSRTSNDY